MKVITSITIFSDAVGMRLSCTYSEVDGNTGKVISDNKRFDRVMTSADMKETANALMAYAQSLVDTEN